MRYFTVGFLIGLTFMTVACGDKKDNPPAAVSQPLVAPTSTIGRVELFGDRVRVINSEQKVIFEKDMVMDLYRTSAGFFAARFWDQGDRVVLINANGDSLLPGGLLFDNARISVSDEIAVIRYFDQGPRVWAMNTAGVTLIHSANLYRNAHVALSDRMVAVTYEDQSASRVLAVDSGGKIWVSNALVFYNPQVILDNHRLWIEHDLGVERYNLPEVKPDTKARPRVRGPRRH